MSEKIDQGSAAGEISRPLAGVKVLELGRLFAAPFATQLLADMGADVIKVERPGHGDEFRHYAPRPVKDAVGAASVESSNYRSVSRNKRSLTVDIGQPDGQRIVRDLARRSDIMVENFKVGALKKYGLDYDSIRALNQDIIYLSVTGFGQNGPYAGRPGADAIFQAMSGLMSLTGEPDRLPQRIGVVVSDLITGLYAANALVMALRAREVLQAGGQHIDMALMDCSVAAVAPAALEYFTSGAVPQRLGPRAFGSAPSEIFRCVDGLLQVQATADPQFHRLCDVVELPELKSDERFATRMNRYQHVEALAAALNARFGSGTMMHWYEKLVAADIMCAPVYSIDQTFEDPQVKHRQMRVDLDRDGVDQVSVIANPIRFGGKPVESYRPPPFLGRDTDEVLASELGLGEREIEQLRQKGVV
ncbi:MAG TPA: CaiB/BaiF CoA-transferase family protein [Caulobacteraceae bacterium]|nr:CaiB/BaiF CoA-transferase family protein [Caulobacteraceae bacterium]